MASIERSLGSLVLYRANHYRPDPAPEEWCDKVSAFEADKAIPWVERKQSIQLADSQKEAVRLALSSKLLVITGGPGVGKTTPVNSILTILAVKGVTSLLCVSTGRAVMRLFESTGLKAKTIHRLLEVDPANGQLKRQDDNLLDCDLPVADECSKNFQTAVSLRSLCGKASWPIKRPRLRSTHSVYLRIDQPVNRGETPYCQKNTLHTRTLLLVSYDFTLYKF